MLIRNYGLFWNRERVFWGRPKVSGYLKGVAAKRLTGGETDFREQQGVYVLYDDTFKVIYVGQTGTGDQRLFVRLRQHRKDHLAQRWSKFSWFGILPVARRGLDQKFKPEPPAIVDVLNHIEAILLATAEPPLNLQRGRFGKDVERYLQFPIEQDDAAARRNTDG